jgi:competence protein ComEA
MFKKTIIATLLALFSALAFAAGVDINKATQAELEAIKGIGPAMATRMLTERKKGEFKDWTDVMGRVKGVKDHQAAKLSDAGLTVNGGAYKASASSDSKKDTAKK